MPAARAAEPDADLVDILHGLLDLRLGNQQGLAPLIELPPAQGPGAGQATGAVEVGLGRGGQPVPRDAGRPAAESADQ